MATYKLIASSTVGSGGASSITFSSIPQTYTDLVVKYSMRDNANGTWHNVQLTFNSSSASYSSRLLWQYDGTVGSGTGATTWLQANYSVGNLGTSSTFSNGEIYIPNYAGSNNKSVSVDVVTENNGTSVILVFAAGLWSNTSAISSITFTPADSATLQQYSTFYLYGISNA